MALAAQIPTYAEFIARFPQFSSTADYPQAQIETIIEEAAVEVGDDWVVADQKPAMLYLTAHLLSMEGADVVDKGQVSSESFGPMSRSYKTTSSSGGYDSTEYGRRYLVIMRRNAGPGIVAVGGDI